MPNYHDDESFTPDPTNTIEGSESGEGSLALIKAAARDTQSLRSATDMQQIELIKTALSRYESTVSLASIELRDRGLTLRVDFCRPDKTTFSEAGYTIEIVDRTTAGAGSSLLSVLETLMSPEGQAKLAEGYAAWSRLANVTCSSMGSIRLSPNTGEQYSAFCRLGSASPNWSFDCEIGGARTWMAYMGAWRVLGDQKLLEDGHRIVMSVAGCHEVALSDRETAEEDAE